MSISARIKHGWNAFRNQEEDNLRQYAPDYGASYGGRPDRVRLFISNERSIISSIYTRIAIDVASIPIRHVRVDENGAYSEDIKSGFQSCLKLESNLDQGPRSFIQDVVMTLFDKGTAAIVPVETTEDPNLTNSYDIKAMRVGDIVTWYPRHVRVSVYDDREKQGGRRQEITLPKSAVAIIENPLYAVMNDHNSTLKRLIRKINLLDVVDEQSSSGKLDIIIQLPYVIKTEARKQQAEQRRKDIEVQLKGSQYGIAYTDGTEKITQLNRPAENNLFTQVEYLTKQLYNELGITDAVINGTADESAMKNYMNRTVEPIMTSIVEAMRPKFLTKTAISQGQWILFFQDPFKLISMNDFAEIADKLSRNEIASANELRQAIGMKPSKDPKADALQNSNMPQQPGTQPADDSQAVVDSIFNEVDGALNDILSELGPG